jgi:heptosyltransferase III
VNPRRILVINVSRIGDTLLCTPALRALTKAWPQARLDFLGHPNRVEIIRHLPFVASARPITKYRALLRGWLGRRWDLALVYGFDRALVTYALRVAEKVVAFRQGDAALDARLYRAVQPPPSLTVHAARALMLLPEALGLRADGMRLAYAVTEKEKAWARAAAPPGQPLIGIQMASFPTKGYRDWPPENFAALCERMVQRWPQARFLLFGGSLERDRTAALAQGLGERARDLAGTLTLRQTAALMDRLDLYVGVDTGPTHIVSALEPPMVALYHCHSPSRLLGPLDRPRCYVVDHPRAAEGCGPDTPMAEITVDAVWHRVLEAMP